MYQNNNKISLSYRNVKYIILKLTFFLFCVPGIVLIYLKVVYQEFQQVCVWISCRYWSVMLRLYSKAFPGIPSIFFSKDSLISFYEFLFCDTSKGFPNSPRNFSRIEQFRLDCLQGLWISSIMLWLMYRVDVVILRILLDVYTSITSNNFTRILNLFFLALHPFWGRACFSA